MVTNFVCLDMCVGEFYFHSIVDSILILFYRYLFFVSDVHILFCERLSTVLKKTKCYDTL